MKLSSYLKSVDETPEAFAGRIGVRKATVYRYLAGTRRPEWDVMAQIAGATQGLVGPADFMEVKEQLAEKSKRRASVAA